METKRFNPKCKDIPTLVEQLNKNRILINYLASMCVTKVDKNKDTVEQFLDKQFESEIRKRREMTIELCWWLNIRKLRK